MSQYRDHGLARAVKTKMLALPVTAAPILGTRHNMSPDSENQGARGLPESSSDHLSSPNESMSMKSASEVIAHNQSLPGRGLRYDLQTTCIARCPSGQHVLKTGLGAAGVGTMWCPSSDEILADPGFEKLPVQDCHGGFGLAFPMVSKCLCCKCSGQEH